MIWNFIKSGKNNYLNKKNIKIISLGVLLVLFIAILVYKKNNMYEIDDSTKHRFESMIGEPICEVILVLGEGYKYEDSEHSKFVYVLENGIEVELMVLPAHYLDYGPKLGEVVYKKNGEVIRDVRMETNKNLSLEYFINNIRYDTTFKDVKREIGDFTGSTGSGIIRWYYEIEGLAFFETYMFGYSDENPVFMFRVEDNSGNNERLIMYMEDEFNSTKYIKKLFIDKKIVLNAKKIKIHTRQFFELNDKYTYADIVNLYGEPHGITDNNRVYYHINSYYVFFPGNFSSDSEAKLNYLDIYSENGMFKCRIQYAPEYINGVLNIFYD